MTSNPSSRDVLIDVVTACTCCTRESVPWPDFFDHYADDSALPDRGDPHPLRVRIRMNAPCATFPGVDLVHVLSQLAREGAVRVDGNEYVATGFAFRAGLVHAH